MEEKRHDLYTHTGGIHAVTGFLATLARGFPELSGTAALQSRAGAGGRGGSIRYVGRRAVIEKEPFLARHARTPEAFTQS